MELLKFVQHNLQLIWLRENRSPETRPGRVISVSKHHIIQEYRGVEVKPFLILVLELWL